MKKIELDNARDGDLVVLKGRFRVLDGKPFIDLGVGALDPFPLLPGVIEKIAEITHILARGDEVRHDGQNAIVKLAVTADGEPIEPGQTPDAYLVDLIADQFGHGSRSKPTGLTLVPARSTYLNRRATTAIAPLSANALPGDIEYVP